MSALHQTDPVSTTSLMSARDAVQAVIEHTRELESRLYHIKGGIEACTGWLKANPQGVTAPSTRQRLKAYRAERRVVVEQLAEASLILGDLVGLLADHTRLPSSSREDVLSQYERQSHQELLSDIERRIASPRRLP